MKNTCSCQDIFDLAREKKCEFIDLKFVDLTGGWKHFTLTISKLDKKLFDRGIGFDGSSIHGFQNTHNSDMLIVPDMDTAFIDIIHECPTISFICDIKDPVTSESYARDPRHVARKAEAYLRSSGIAETSYWGPELEFFIFNSVSFDTNSRESFYHINTHEEMWNSGNNPDGSSGYYFRHKEGYFGIPPNDQLLNLRSKIVKALIQSGLEIDFHHHEVAAAGQSEIGMRYGPLVRQADRVLLSKYLVKNIAKQNGYTATFMPKPVYLDNGNAMHVHQSLWKDGINLFYDSKGYALLSQMARYYIGGLLLHSPAILAFCAPSTNSYRRLVPGYEAPVDLTYSRRSRNAAIRIPIYSSSPDSLRIEYRCPDSTSNPYLAFAAILMAGLDGIQNRIDPGQPEDNEASGPKTAGKGCTGSIPHSFGEVLDALEEDHDFLLKGGVFTADLIETWVGYKRKNEVEAMSLRPHPYEFSLYYDV